MSGTRSPRTKTPRLRGEERTRVGAAWVGRMRQEHLAVGAFGRLTAELAATGCDGAVLELVARAAADEVAHAEICRRMARLYLDEASVPRDVQGECPLPTYDLDRDEAALLNVVAMCCLSETFTVAYFTALLKVTTVPEARRAVRTLLADELHHGRLGWAHLVWSLERDRRHSAGRVRALVAHWLPALLDQTAAPVFEEARAAPERDAPRLVAHGHVGRDTSARVYRDALASIIMPGFARCGIDVAGAARWIEEHAAGSVSG